ncbi:MAG: hypothetical protein AAFQ82_09040 [Myxococcota bacterium]
MSRVDGFLRSVERAQSTEASTDASTGAATRTSSRASSTPIDATEFASLYRAFRRLGRDGAQNAVSALKNPDAPHHDFALARVLEEYPMTTASWAFEAYGRERQASRGLEINTVVAELEQFFGDEEVVLTGRATAFDDVNAATAYATAQGASPEHDAVVLAQGERFFVHTVGELRDLDGPNSPEELHGRFSPRGHRVVLFTHGQQAYSMTNDAEVQNNTWFGGALSALHGGDPIVAIGGHGTFNVSGGPDAEGNYATAIGGHVGATSGQDIKDGLSDVRAVLFIAAGCNTAHYGEQRGDLGPSFLRAESARTFIGTRGFMQNGAHINGIRRILNAMRRGPTRPLRDIVDAENVIQERNRLQDASFVMMGDEELTYAQILELSSGNPIL